MTCGGFVVAWGGEGVRGLFQGGGGGGGGRGRYLLIQGAIGEEGEVPTDAGGGVGEGVVTTETGGEWGGGGGNY